MSGSTRDSILDATLRVAGNVGLARLSMEDVATDAGVSRQTIYRYFESRQVLIEQAILREEAVFIESMMAAAAAHDDLERALAASVETSLKLADEHPLLQRLLAEDPETLLPFLIGGRGPVISAAEPVVRELLTRRRPGVPEQRARLAAEVATRLLLSFLVARPDMGRDVLAREVGRLVAGYIDA